MRALFSFRDAMKVPMLRMRYVVDFTERKTEKSSVFSSGASASAGGSVNVALVPEGTRLVINTDSANVNVESPGAPFFKLSKPVISADTSWLKETREVNATSNRAQEVGVAIFSAAMALSSMGGTSAKQRDYEVVMDAAGYGAAVEKMTGAARKTFLARVKAEL